MTLLLWALKLLYLLLPAAVANMMPVIVDKAKVLQGLAIPVDAGMRYHKQPFLGTHKTWRGLFTGIVAAALVAWLQSLIAPTPFDLVDYSAVWLPLGLLLGTGALIGDIIKSFFKRRVGIKEGSAWAPFDQIDFGIGAIVFAYPVIWLGWPLSFAAVTLLAVCHVFIVWLGYHLGWRKSVW